MNIQDIRNMSDVELTRFLNNISQRNYQMCCKCGGNVYDKNKRIGIFVYKDVSNKKLCTLCKGCYSDLLDYLGISDID